MIKIPVPDLNDPLVEAILDDRTFYLNFSWNDTATLWTLSIQDSEKMTLLSSLPLLPDIPLLTRFRRRYLPIGELVVVTDTTTRQRLTRDSFLLGHADLVYLTRDDILGTEFFG